MIYSEQMRRLWSVKIFVVLGLLFCLSLFAASLTNQSAKAYTCDWSNNGGNQYTSESGFSGTLKNIGGSCVLQKPDGDGVSPNSVGACPRDKPLKDNGQCFQTRSEYTNLVPTNDDGSAVSQQDWTSLCEQSDFTRYNATAHRCENVTGAILQGCQIMTWDSDSIDGDCEAIGHGDAATIESIKQDDTGAKVRECNTDLNAKNGGGWDGTTQSCKWSQAGCEAKNGGQGLWINNGCKSYTDFSSSKEECDSVKGEFIQDPKNATRWQCQKPGTTFKDGDKSPTAQAPNGSVNKTTDKCGNARVNILTCSASASDANAVFTDVLRIAVIALTMIVGAAALGGLAYSAMQYARASDDTGVLSDAKTRIRNIVIGLFLYGFIIAIVNYLVPGGVF